MRFAKPGWWGLMLLAIVLSFFTIPAKGAITPESDVLLPWFGIDLTREDQGLATKFTVVNASPKPVNAAATVYTNWGIPVLEIPLAFNRSEAKTLLVHEWIGHGKLPDRMLTPAELANLQAMLTGKPSPVDGLYYSTPFGGTSPNIDAGSDVAVGYVIVRTLGDRPDVLWGDTHTLDPVANYFEAETLNALSHGLKADCNYHGIRFDNEGLLYEGDELFVWSGRRFTPSMTPTPIGPPMKMTVKVYDQAGNLIHTCYKELIAVETVLLCHEIDIPIGWLEITTEDPTVIFAHLHSLTKASAALHSYCLRQDVSISGPAIAIEKKIDNDDADLPPGPRYDIGAPIEFEYYVTNSGSEALTAVGVTDDTGIEVTCPKTALNPGESMICTAQSIAKGCVNVNTGTAVGTAPNGTRVSASDIANYHALYRSSIALELLVNDNEADEPKGPVVKVGDPLYWTFLVTNTGDSALTGIAVVMKNGEPASCPKTELAAGESMTCTMQTLAQQGQRHEIGTVKAVDPCDTPVDASDPAYYFGRTYEPSISIEKYVLESDADTPPGPTIPAGTTIEWRFIVTNTGEVPLTDVVVSDEGLTLQCPKTALEPGESMTCTASSIALPCQHTNTAHARAKADGERTVNASDPANYFGEGSPALALELKINGETADVPPGPSVNEGSALNFTYEVTNSGNVELTNIVVNDDSDHLATCPKTTLQPGETMICTWSGVATAGSHEITGFASGKPPCGEGVNASDPAFYTGYTPNGSIDLLKMTNGVHAEAPPGVGIPIGSIVNWSYLVTNTGQVPITGIVLTDTGGVTPVCPKTALEVGESMTCTASGTAVPCQYTNTAKVEGKANGETVASMDDSFYFGEFTASIGVVKKTNGESYAKPPGLTITTGATVVWTYVITNTGNVALTSVGVVDDRVGAVVCPKSALDAGESMTCSASGVALAGQQANIATATGTGPCRGTVTANDTNYYLGVTPGIAIEKLINGEDADDSEHAVHLAIGAPVLWSFVVTNIGDVTLSEVKVTDSNVTPTCPKTTLVPGESMTCTASGFAGEGLECNTGTASGTSPQAYDVSATDTACYTGDGSSISIKKSTNGADADTPPGPNINVGDPVQWTYVVTNTGQTTLTQVAVTDDKGVAVTCPKTTLTPGESMTCTASGTAIAGQYANIGTASGKPDGGTAVTATDPSHYYGQQVGNQGCTPGYWKNHTDSWPPTGYSPTQAVSTVFPEASRYAGLGTSSLLTALGFGGGSGTSGAAEILLRAAVAALLNAAHTGVSYPRTPAAIISDVNIALASENRDTMLALAAQLDADNNLGCPLN